jgi:hypothetical protein
VMTRTMQAIEAAGAATETQIILADENSLWGCRCLCRRCQGCPWRQDGDNLRNFSVQGV